ncbi:hypothetical protein DFH09DRAFT_1475556 [Mycena vulgaris]|nr:hypothetical protein DFH09DRAFT_1475556 [Mycena vulgaris]
MSARQPFVPGGFAPSSRPESRTAHPSAPAPHFVADPSNPLHGGVNTQKPHNEIPEAPPLNIGSLTKDRAQNPPSRRPSLQTNYPPRPATSDPHSLHASSSNHNLRPGTSDPHARPKSIAAPNHRLQGHSKSHIVAPTPLQARSTPSLFSNASTSFASSFKTPALPAPHTPPQQHPPVDAHGFRTPTDDPMLSQITDHQPSPDQSREEPDETTGFRIRTLPSQSAPHRSAFGSRGVTDLTQEDEIYEIPEAEVASLTANGRNKRGRSEVDDDEDDEHAHMQSYGAPAKRFKTQKTRRRTTERQECLPPLFDGRERAVSPLLQPARCPRVPSSPAAAPPRTRSWPIRQQQSSRHRRRPPLPAPIFRQFQLQLQLQLRAAAASSEIARLAQLFKAEQLDFDCDARIEKYTRLAEKWKGCTREEWMAGADELTALYTKIFDFAKSHMAEKLQLFATCDARLQQQTEVLSDRDALLVGAKETFAVEGANVLKNLNRSFPKQCQPLPSSLLEPPGPVFGVLEEKRWPSLPKPNLELSLDFGAIDADIEVLPLAPEGHADHVPRSSQKKVDLKASTVTANITLRVHAPSAPIDLRVQSSFGQVRVFLPRTLHGPLVIATALRRAHFSAALRRVCTSVLEVRGTTRWFVGDVAAWSAGGERGDKVWVGSGFGELWVGYIGEEAEAERVLGRDLWAVCWQIIRGLLLVGASSLGFMLVQALWVLVF